MLCQPTMKSMAAKMTDTCGNCPSEIQTSLWSFILNGFQHRINNKESTQHNQDKLKLMSLRPWWQTNMVPRYELWLTKVKWKEAFCWVCPAAMLCLALPSRSYTFRQGWSCGFLPPTLTIFAEQESQIIMRRGIEEEQEAGGLCCHKAQCDGFLWWSCICIDSWRWQACVLGHRVWFLKHVYNRAAGIKKSWNLCKRRRRREHTFNHIASKLLEVCIRPAHCFLAQSTMWAVFKKIRQWASY